MKLSDLAASNDVKAFVYGPSSTGKTCFAASCPTPIRYLDFDNKVSSAAQHYKADSERLQNIDVTQYAEIERAKRMKQFQADVQAIMKLHYDKKPLPFKTLVVDSLTTFCQYALEDFMNVSRTDLKRPGANLTCYQDYALLDHEVFSLLRSILTLSCNVIVIGHSHTDKDESSGAVTNQVLMPGKSAAKLPIYFEEIYFSRVDAAGKFFLQTQSDSKTVCRTQRKLAKEIPTNYASIIGAK